PGAMRAVIHPDGPLPPLPAGVEVAAENGPGLSAVSGPEEAIAALETRLDQAGIGWRRLRTSHGFHSAAMEGAAEAFAARAAKMRLCAPRIPMISNLSGTWLTEAEATDPAYWGRHLRRMVRFGEGAATALSLEASVFVETGPGGSLASLLRHQGAARVVPGLAAEKDALEEALGAVGAAWRAGLSPDWRVLAPGARRRVALPGYPFERRRHWVEPDAVLAETPAPSGEARIYAPSWRSAAPAPAAEKSRRGWLIFDDGAAGRALAEALERAGDDAYRVEIGEGFAEPGYRGFTLAPGAGAGDLLAALAERGAAPKEVVFAWPLGEAPADALTRALHDLVGALASADRELRLTVLTRGAADVTGAEPLAADRALLHGQLQVAGQEHPKLGCRILDLDPEERAPPEDLALWLRRTLLEERDPIAARRGGRLWRLSHQPCAAGPAPAQRRNGVFAVIGHVAEGMGRVWAGRLAATPGLRLALIEDDRAAPVKAPEGDALMRVAADCAEAGALGAALDQVAARWGRIDGVFLSTPFSDVEVTAPLALLGDGQRARADATCVAPLEALAGAVASRRVGFCCVQSSLSSVIGGVGLAAYAGAHHHADIRVAVLSRTGGCVWRVVNWDALETGTGERGKGPVGDFALSPDMVWEATLRVVGEGPEGRVVVSRGDVDARRREWLNPAPKTESAAPAGGRKRPDLENPFVAPRTPVEAEVAGVLQDLLGLDRIGVEDGFFELGGHSLLAIRAIARLREAFPVQIEMRELLTDNPSAAGIARLIEEKLAGDADLAALVAEVSDLSEDELRAALEEGVGS
ncbi:MAG: acyltransferase domain-containing protein, partial [Pikeienuella sp.]